VPDAFVRSFQESCLYRPVPPAFLEQVLRESAKLPARVWRAVYDGFRGFDVRDRLHRIACPTLLLWGAHDAVFGRAEQETLLAGLPEATLRVYEDSGHAPNWEEPQRFALDATAFVAHA
jgi:pimeloyl-ACP methyl ester carboxylesterase